MKQPLEAVRCLCFYFTVRFLKMNIGAVLVLDVFHHISTQRGSMRDAVMLVLEDLCF